MCKKIMTYFFAKNLIYKIKMQFIIRINAEKMLLPLISF